MFTWVCPKCGREVPPAYNDCPDCAPVSATQPVSGAATLPEAVTPPPSQAAGPSGSRGARRPLWATGAQEPLPPAPPPSFAPPAPPPPAPAFPAAAGVLEEPPAFRPPKPVTSPLFAPAPPASTYTAPPPAGQPKWLLGVAIAVIVVIVGGGLYWFFGRSQTTSAVIESAPATAAPAGENPLQKYIEVTGVRFGPITKGVGVTFVIINHSNNDLSELVGTATISAKTNSGQEIQVGTVKFDTGLPAQGSKELALPLNTKMKLMEMPDWQNASVTVQITSPTGA